jgi:hypothetical protein
MLWLRTGWTGDAERSDNAMNAYAILVVNDHLETLRADAAARRSARVERPSLVSRIAATVANLKIALSTPVESANAAH